MITGIVAIDVRLELETSDTSKSTCNIHPIYRRPCANFLATEETCSTTGRCCQDPTSNPTCYRPNLKKIPIFIADSSNHRVVCVIFNSETFTFSDQWATSMDQYDFHFPISLSYEPFVSSPKDFHIYVGEWDSSDIIVLHYKIDTNSLVVYTTFSTEASSVIGHTVVAAPREKQCTVLHIDRQECPGSYPGITLLACRGLQMDCCFDDMQVSTRLRCYNRITRNEATDTSCFVHEYRADPCPGNFPGITREECLSLPYDCCFMYIQGMDICMRKNVRNPTYLLLLGAIQSLGENYAIISMDVNHYISFPRWTYFDIPDLLYVSMPNVSINVQIFGDALMKTVPINKFVLNPQSESLPRGLYLNETSGTIYGSPLTVTNTSHNYTIRASNAISFMDMNATLSVTCRPGRYYDAVSQICTDCPIGTYRSGQNSTSSCIECSDENQSTTSEGSSLKIACSCLPGYASMNEGCDPCPMGNI